MNIAPLTRFGTRVGLLCRICLLGVALVGGMALAADEEFRDPTRPPDVSAPTAQGDQGTVTREWILSSVVVSGERRTAILNGQRIAPGDEIGGATVLEVSTAGVTLKLGTQRFTVPVVRAVKTKSSMRELNQ